eukprot:2481682-Prymnesium_polylepis.2
MRLFSSSASCCCSAPSWRCRTPRGWDWTGAPPRRGPSQPRRPCRSHESATRGSASNICSSPSCPRPTRLRRPDFATCAPSAAYGTPPRHSRTHAAPSDRWAGPGTCASRPCRRSIAWHVVPHVTPSHVRQHARVREFDQLAVVRHGRLLFAHAAAASSTADVAARNAG